MNDNETYVFQLGKNDIGTVMIDGLRLQWTNSCPFAANLSSYASGSGIISADLQEIIQDEICRKALAVLAAPSKCSVFNTGGGVTNVSYLNIYSNKSLAGEAVVSITPSFEDSILIQYFNAPEYFAQWFADTLTMAGDDEVETLLPQSFSVEALIYVFHTIDVYRRLTYKNLLEYRTDIDPMISSQEYSVSLNTSVNSRDARWLLPAFAMLTPNLARYGIQIAPDSLKMVLDSNLLLPIINQATGEEFFKFGEPGRKLATAFYGSWLLAAGFESMSFEANGAITTINNGFIAPTAGGSHLFMLSQGASGKGVVNYRNLAYSRFVEQIKALISNTAERPVEISSVLKCVSCGTELTVGTKFCKSCGAKQN